MSDSDCIDSHQLGLLTQFQALPGPTDNYDDVDEAISIHGNVGWNVKPATYLFFNTELPMSQQPRQAHNEPILAQHSFRPGSLIAVVQPILNVFTYALDILSKTLRSIFFVLCFPILSLRFSPQSFYFHLPRKRARLTHKHKGPENWLTELEKETGAVSVAASVTALEEGKKLLPNFSLVPYDDIISICYKDTRIGCVMLFSEEHDGVAEFKRSTLTDPTFVALLNDHGLLVWGGDVCGEDARSASEKLQVKTYPFVAFVTFQPECPSGSTSKFTVLSRHQGPSTDRGPTSAQNLCKHLTNHIEQIQNIRLEQEADQSVDRLLEEQGRVFEKARWERERVKLMIEQEMQETLKQEQYRRRVEIEEEERRRQKEERRMQWRRWLGRVHSVNGRGTGEGKTTIVAVRLPSGRRVIRAFEERETLTSLYAFVDAQLVLELTCGKGQELKELEVGPDGSDWDKMEKSVEGEIEREGEGSSWWGFSLALAYSRKEIPWLKGKSLSELEDLQAGAQVVEITG